ncbi:ATP-binding protein [Actinospongicola halichondriae]|uniref:ATP-binding protein n=1 Tax=Actinospongicola halichondriae TaxID=3236844 RepID=UPI003D4DC2F8
MPLTPDRFSARPIDGLADLAVLRSEFGQWLEKLGVDDEKIDDLLVVISELAANAVRESAADADPPTVEASFDTREVELAVANAVDVDGHREPKGGWDLDDPLRAGGRGLLVVSALVDEVDVEVQGQRLCVRCRMAIAGDQRGSTVT